MSENEKPEECNFCGYETTELTFYHSRFATVENAWLCRVCAGTPAGSAYHYPRNYENKDIMKQISYCTNMILDAVKEKAKNNGSTINFRGTIS